MLVHLVQETGNPPPLFRIRIAMDNAFTLMSHSDSPTVPDERLSDTWPRIAHCRKPREIEASTGKEIQSIGRGHGKKVHLGIVRLYDR